MQSNSEIAFLDVKRELNDFTCPISASNADNSYQTPVELSSSSDNDDSYHSNSKQLVLYDPAANGTDQIQAVPDPIWPPITRRPRSSAVRRFSSRVLPSVGTFTVQCANCFNWRLIPTKEKYEQIRERILELPFVCEAAREWRPDISCDAPTDLSQDDGRLWAIDKPNIAQPPPGWQRLLRIRSEGSTKFADVYYVAPSGKRLRSMVEIQRYLMEHPEYVVGGATISQFSFQTPKPLQDDYVRKRTPRLTASYDNMSGVNANPLSWVSPGDLDLQVGGAPLYLEAPFLDSIDKPAVKKAKAKIMSWNKVNDYHQYRLS